MNDTSIFILSVKFIYLVQWPIMSLVMKTWNTWLLVQTSRKERRRQWHPTPVLLPGKSHEWRSPIGCSPWGPEESDTTERLCFHFSLSCIGEGNGNPLQCSFLENPRDGGAWWASVYGVAQSRTRLKRLRRRRSRKEKNLLLKNHIKSEISDSLWYLA